MALFPVIVGYVDIPDPREVTQHYETASWFHTIVAPPGRYPVVALEPKPKWVYVEFTGEVTAAYMASRGPGYVGPNEAEKDVGTIMQISDMVSVPIQTGMAMQVYVDGKGGEVRYTDVVLNDRISWDPEDGAECWEHVGRKFSRPIVRGMDPADLLFAVTSVNCYEMNAGHQGAFWYVSCVTEGHDTDGKRWSGANDGTGRGYGGAMVYRGEGGKDEHGFTIRERHLTEAQARQLVAAVQSKGVVCPAYWTASSGY